MKKQWWHKKVAYQIYPKSFMDTNHDGIGDLKGIIEKIDYLSWLGIDLIWISPIFKSPMVDNGYDISDYYAIDESFGTMEEFDELLRVTKEKKIEVILDLVINHCSSEHVWFQKAVEDPEGYFGKFFYIKETCDGNPPNNWRSYFGGSAWEKLPGHEHKYYLHSFAKEQPDLNWENKELREELFKMVNWWLEKGIAGFRIDAIMNIKKDLTFANLEPDGPDGMGVICHSMDKAEGIGDFLTELKVRCFEPHDALTVGEVFLRKTDELKDFIGENGYFSTMFDFVPSHLNRSGVGFHEYLTVSFKTWRDSIFQTQKETYDFAFEANILENHDEPRGANLYIPEGEAYFYSLSALATISILLRGLPFLYQGQELGMTNSIWDSVEEFNDIGTIDQFHYMMQCGLSEEEALKHCSSASRDNSRTPMQWDTSEYAGFSTVKPWIKVNPNYVDINVEKQKEEYGSLLNFYKRLIAFRKAEEYVDLFTYGKLEETYLEEETIFAYFRELEDQKVLLISNFSSKETKLLLNEKVEDVIFVNYEKVTFVGNQLLLKPYETIVVKVLED